MTRVELIPAWAALPSEELLAAKELLAPTLTVRHLAVPQQGLWLLTMEESLCGDCFHLGEVPVAEALVEVTQDGRTAQGGARLLGATAEVTLAVAIFDAVVTGGLDGSVMLQALARRGQELRQGTATARAAWRQATRVDFCELGQDQVGGGSPCTNH